MLLLNFTKPSCSPRTSPHTVVGKAEWWMSILRRLWTIYCLNKEGWVPLTDDQWNRRCTWKSCTVHISWFAAGTLANTCAEKRNLKTALAAQHGHLSFRVMPFGRGNAPTTLQRVMDHVLYGRNWTHCLVYLDDVVVFAPTEEEHLQILDLVLGRIAKAGLTLKPAEYHRMKKSVNSLGFIVWSERASVDRAKWNL